MQYAGQLRLLKAFSAWRRVHKSCLDMIAASGKSDSSQRQLQPGNMKKSEVSAAIAAMQLKSQVFTLYRWLQRGAERGATVRCYDNCHNDAQPCVVVLQHILYAELQQSPTCAHATNFGLMLEAATAVEGC